LRKRVRESDAAGHVLPQSKSTSNSRPIFDNLDENFTTTTQEAALFGHPTYNMTRQNSDPHRDGRDKTKWTEVS
jgi:hypothetical protein